MSRGRVTHLDPWRDEPAHCDSCGWSGLGKDASIEYFEVIEEVRCPMCDVKLFMVGNPTREETGTAAAAGNPAAISHLGLLDDMDRAHAQIAQARKGRDQLPDLDGNALEFTFVPEGGRDWMSPQWLILTCSGIEIYREGSGYEGWAAIIEIGQKVVARYPGRVAWIDPGAAGDCLGGDKLYYDTDIRAFLDRNHIAPPNGNWASKKWN